MAERARSDTIPLEVAPMTSPPGSPPSPSSILLIPCQGAPIWLENLERSGWNFAGSCNHSV